MRESGEAEIQTQTMFSRLEPRWSVLQLWPGMMHFLATITRKGTYLLLNRIKWFILSSISYAIPGYSITAIHALKANYRLFRFLDLNTGGENAEMIWRYEARHSLLTCDTSKWAQVLQVTPGWQFADSWAEDNYRDQHLQSAGAVTERGFTSYYIGDTAMVIGCIYMATLAPHGDEY